MSENRTIVQHSVCLDPKTEERITVTRALPTDADAATIGRAIADLHGSFWFARKHFGERAERREALIAEALVRNFDAAERAGKKVDRGRLKGELRAIETTRTVIQSQLEADTRLLSEGDGNGSVTEH